jgi:hypothetical protein
MITRRKTYMITFTLSISSILFVIVQYGSINSNEKTKSRLGTNYITEVDRFDQSFNLKFDTNETEHFKQNLSVSHCKYGFDQSVLNDNSCKIGSYNIYFETFQR